MDIITKGMRGTVKREKRRGRDISDEGGKDRIMWE